MSTRIMVVNLLVSIASLVLVSAIALSNVQISKWFWVAMILLTLTSLILQTPRLTSLFRSARRPAA